MSLTVNAPFLKFYNLCYLITQSTGCSVGSDHGPGERSHEILTWTEECRWLARIPVFHLPPSYTPLFVVNSHKLESFCPLLKLTLTSMESCGWFLILTIRFCPINVDTHLLRSGRFPLSAARKAHEPKASKVHLQPMGNSRKCRWGLGATRFSCTKVPVSFTLSD